MNALRVFPGTIAAAGQRSVRSWPDWDVQFIQSSDTIAFKVIGKPTLPWNAELKCVKQITRCIAMRVAPGYYIDTL